MRKDRDIPYIGKDALAFTLTSAATADSEALKQASRLGIVAGLRSMTPLAVLTWSETEVAPKLKTITALLAAGELIGDKLPFTPSRLKPGSVLFRLTIGATAGALLCKRIQQPVLTGAIRGAVGAAIGTVAGYAYRTVAADVTGIPDIVWAIIEDGVAVGLGRLATTSDTQNL
ncbi:hypothetical protein [Dictyobacter arantiisoli]|nr:hypothetical protein [Dictyobacter arantiisoli]